jgi:hypothetical protein
MNTTDRSVVVQCPHCEDWIFIEQINCNVFRHGVFIISGQPIPPHSPKSDCDMWKETGAIYGCGKPFTLVSNSVAEACEYR